MAPREQTGNQIPIKLTLIQRRAAALLVPSLAPRLRLDEAGVRAIPVTSVELEALRDHAQTAIRQTASGKERIPLRAITGIAERALAEAEAAAGDFVYQLKITLQGAKPPIWRRIQVRDGPLDELNEHIQNAMGWTNSHLHHFIVDRHLYGDPMLMAENWVDLNYKDSTRTTLSDLLPKDGAEFRFQYEYDFGDGWMHEVLVEGVVPTELGRRYPVCVAGARACPPEDVGGVPGYQDFIEAIADPAHERHDELLEWSGPFDPEAFDPAVATKQMHRGFPDWRRWQ